MVDPVDSGKSSNLMRRSKRARDSTPRKRAPGVLLLSGVGLVLLAMFFFAGAVFGLGVSLAALFAPADYEMPGIGVPSQTVGALIVALGLFGTWYSLWRLRVQDKRRGSSLWVTFGRIVATTTCLLSSGYLVLVLINWSDQPPSETTIRFSSLYENLSNPADDNNAYTYMLGFLAPPEADPYELGMRRRAWIQRAFAASEVDAGPEPGAGSNNYRSERSPAIANLVQACNTRTYSGCIEALVESESAVAEWLNSEEWLLDRYIDLIALTGHREAAPFDYGLPLPRYGDIFDARRLMFVRAWAAGESGNAGLVQSLLHRDLVFWRMVVANSDTVITKMIAVDAVISHFRMANEIIRELQRGGLDVPMPLSWQMAISDAERSMQRSLIGEWHLTDRTVKRTYEDVRLADFGGSAYVLAMAISPFWQPQDLSNRYAEGVTRYIDLFDAPYDSIPDAISRVEQMPALFPRPFSRAYNLAGDYAFVHGFPDFSSFGVRVADLEGVRRAAVAAWRLRAEGVAEDDMESRLRVREWANPYTNLPLEWDGSTNEVVFQGRQSGERGRYAFPY